MERAEDGAKTGTEEEKQKGGRGVKSGMRLYWISPAVLPPLSQLFGPFSPSSSSLPFSPLQFIQGERCRPSRAVRGLG